MTGATGYLGSRLLPRLLDDPSITQIRSVARRPLGSWAGHSKIVHTEADLRDDDARRALDGVDVLWHLGFALWRGGDSAHLNLDGTRNVLAARPGRVILASSVAVYGAWPDNPIPLTEDHWPRPNPECPYASQKLTAERLCREAAPTTVLRIAAALGPHADPSIERATLGYRRAVPAIRAVTQAVQFLDEDDAASALHVAGSLGPAGVFNIAPPDWLSERDIARLAGSRVVRLPAKAVVRASDVAFRLGLLPFGADRAILINGPMAVDASKAAEELGWRATHGSAEVLSAALSRG
ncbi:MAG TPA: NAD-dependent epimerase/dehydratase family protein [Acidimicrobiales bacterium]|nr:NAD-dependent epimerase/dehydratase family protein [Acidimicrobiales bacterium]